MEYERETVVRNRQGLHFRPIMQIVELLSGYGAAVTVRVEDRAANARSPFELLMLMATQGTRLRFAAEGEDAPAALDALVKLIETGFNED